MIRDFIIGTLGHAGHGKTALVDALTGVETEGPSIDLRFRTLYLPSGSQAGVVDVPGRAAFIKKVIAGAAGIDFLLLAISAKTGPQSRTREHLAIAELLGVGTAVIALTKVDTVDENRIRESEGRVRDLLAPGPFKKARIVRVSAVTKEGLSDLVAEIEAAARGLAERTLDFPVRLPIDHTFPLSKNERIVTGPLWSGVLTGDSELELQSTGEICGLHRIEVHGHQVSKALPGQRVEVSLRFSGRPPVPGDFLATPATFFQASEITGKVSVLPGAQSITGEDRLRLYHGTLESAARVTPLGVKEIAPGREAFARIVTSRPLPAVFRDRFILRTFSSKATVAGGIVLEPRPRAEKGATDLIHLEALVGDDTIVVRELFRGDIRPLAVEDVAHGAQIGDEAAKRALNALTATGDLTELEAWRRVFFVETAKAAQAREDLAESLAKHHAQYPDEYGPGQDFIRAALWAHLSSSQSEILLDHFIKVGLIEHQDGGISASGRFGTDPLQIQLKRLLGHLASFSPPKCPELAAAAGLTESATKSLLARLEIEGRISAVARELYFANEMLDQARDILTEYLLEAGEITARKFQELLGVDDCYAGALLEYFDRARVTRRLSDAWVLFK